MPTRFLVTKKYHVPGRGPTVVGRLLEGNGITQGMILRDELTGTPVEIRGIETHTRQTAEGIRYGFVLDENGARTVGPSSVLVGSEASTRTAEVVAGRAGQLRSRCGPWPSR